MKKLLMQHEEKMRSDTAGEKKKKGVPHSFKQLRVEPYTNHRSCLNMLSSVCMSYSGVHLGRLKLEPLSARTHNTVHL